MSFKVLCLMLYIYYYLINLLKETLKDRYYSFQVTDEETNVKGD